MGNQVKTSQEQMLDDARQMLMQADKCLVHLALHVRKGDDPSQALREIRTFLSDSMNRENTAVALAVACLDRVLETLDGFEMRIVYERRGA